MIMAATEIIAGVADKLFNFGASDYMLEKKDRLMREQWQRQNEYDSPSEQIKRMRAAGLNPDLAYGGMTHGSPVQGIESDMMSGNNFASGVSSAIEHKQMEQRLELEKEETNSRIDLNAANAEKARAEAREAESHSSYYDRLVQAQDILDDLRVSQSEHNRQLIAQSIEQIDNIKADTDWVRSRQFYQDLQNAHFDEKLAADLGLIRAKTADAYASAGESRQHAALLREQTKQAEELTKVCARRLQYEMEILANEKSMSDADRDSTIARMFHTIYDEMRYRGLIVRDSDGNWHPTNAGAALMATDGVIDYVGRIAGAVGNFYTHHSFYNATPSQPGQPPVTSIETNTINTTGGRRSTTTYHR